MLTKKELAEIRARFEAAGADRPMRIEGDHLKEKTGAVDLGWSVYAAEGLKIGDKELPVVYASHTTFEAATFLVHLPVDIQQMLADLEHFHLLLAGVLRGNEEAIGVAKYLVKEREGQKRGKRGARKLS